MILHSIQIMNFRQISGDYTLKFARSRQRNVTIVLGENGAGKSTLLNAFRWCLYGDVEMENPDEILSHHAVYHANIGDRLSVEVALTFDHEGRIHKAVRRREYQKLDGGELNPVGEEVFDLTAMNENGECKTVDGAAGFVQNLLPDKLSRFFFFQGESILQLALQRSRDRLRDGVETFLELKVLDRAMSHLKSIQGDFDKDLGNSASGELAQIQQEIDTINADTDDLQSQAEQIDANMAANAEQTEITQQRLAEVEEFRPLFQRDAELKVLLVQLRNQRTSAETDLQELISRDGFLVFSSRILAEPPKLAEDAVKKGELPAKIKPQFVQDIMDRGECICGSTIDANMAVTLQEWKQRTGLAELEEAVAATRQGIYNLGQNRLDRFAKDFPEARARIADLDEQIRIARGEESDIALQISNVSLDQAEILQLREAYDRLKDELLELKFERRRIDDRIEAKESEFAQKTSERATKAKAKNQEQLLARRSDSASRVRQALQAIRRDWTGFVQEFLDGRMKESWDRVAQLPRRVSFNKDFSLTIEERGGGGDWVTSAPSEANCAVLALTFVSTLIRFALEISQDKDRDHSIFSGGEFPLVMDAPFAKMDVEFKTRVPAGLAENVPQIILISSVDQWSGMVANALAPSTDKAYVLVLHKPGDSGDIRRVQAFGEEVDYVITDEQGSTDWSEIREVPQ